MKRSKKTAKKASKKSASVKPTAKTVPVQNRNAAVHIAQSRLTDEITEAAREAFSVVQPKEDERVFQVALQGALVKQGGFVEKISDVPGRVNSVGYDMRYTIPGVIDAMIEVKTAPDFLADFTSLKAFLRPAQAQKRTIVEAYGSPLLRYYIVVFTPTDFVVQDITETE